MIQRVLALAALCAAALAAACAQEKPGASAPAGHAAASGASLLRPKDPTSDRVAGTPADVEAVRRGFRIFNRTQIEAAAYGVNELACANCHLDGGQKVGAFPLAGCARTFPQKAADGRRITLEDRIARCFTHSLNGRAPEAGSVEVAALAAYIRWLDSEAPPGEPPAWLQSTALPPERRVPIAELNAERGRQKYDRYCSSCHGLDGQGYRDRRPNLPYDYFPPVWGPRSYNDAAGLARVYTLAGFIRFAMPWDDPGEVPGVAAQEIAAFVNGQPRPHFAEPDAWDGTSPVDAVYDTRQYPKNPFSIPLAQ